MGFEDEVEQSFGRPCRQTNGRSERTCELTSSIRRLFAAVHEFCLWPPSVTCGPSAFVSVIGGIAAAEPLTGAAVYG